MLLVALVLFGVGGRSVRDMGRGCVSIEAGNAKGTLGRGGGMRVGFSVKKSVGWGRQGVGGGVARLVLAVAVLRTWRV